MYLGDNIEIKFNNPNEEFTLGIFCQAGDAYPFDETTGETDFDVEPKTVYRLVIGILIASLVIYW